jgi:hypothetical protein
VGWPGGDRSPDLASRVLDLALEDPPVLRAGVEEDGPGDAPAMANKQRLLKNASGTYVTPWIPGPDGIEGPALGRLEPFRRRSAG